MGALRIERDGDVLRATLARPGSRNAFDAALIAELTQAFDAVGGDVRAVLLAGDGPSFCAGADVEWQRASIDLSFDENVEDALRLHAMLAALDSCPAPLVARVQGYDRIPVVLLDGREHGYWRVEEERLRRDLAQPPR